ncbi:hypothetical protein RhiXN_03456 [Rhizoctonia solani]|uniref:Uncharacterized protein n=1 Tax=Rhizoctonia solani TaxID=456999 RepID=A0A8H8NTN1_9AGAM|nr:uncharacterized protein RhiXN_03456 [Rhizoctonia solani]QRW18532.1 hypothetical protein RhiXN_03456 [Rhizoctonia solani]
MSVLSTLARQQSTFTNLIKDIIDTTELINNDIDGESDNSNETTYTSNKRAPRVPVDLDNLSLQERLDGFCFTKSKVDRMIVALDIPIRIRCENRVSKPANVALPILLQQLAYPARYVNIYHAYRWEKSQFSWVTRALALYLYYWWSHILYFDPQQLNQAKLAAYAAAVYDKGAVLHNVWGFVNGNLWQTAQPVCNQQMLYNGWKQIHALKFHSVCTPDVVTTL